MATEQTSSSSSDAQATPRKRPKPGERRIQILQTLAAMLEQPGAERRNLPPEQENHGILHAVDDQVRQRNAVEQCVVNADIAVTVDVVRQITLGIERT